LAYNQALALAVADASSKAQIIAQALGQRLGDAIHVGEAGTITPSPMPRAVGARAEMMVAEADFFSVPVHSGELEIVARVQVTFTLLP